jgi:hypothetical protein
VAVDLDQVGREPRNPAGEARPALHRRPARAGEEVRHAQPRHPDPADLADQPVELLLGDVLSPEQEATARRRTLDCRDDAGGDVVHEDVVPAPLRLADERRQAPVRQVEQVAHQDVALGELARAVDHSRVDDRERHSGGDRPAGVEIRDRLGALVVVDPAATFDFTARGEAGGFGTLVLYPAGSALCRPEGDEARDVEDRGRLRMRLPPRGRYSSPADVDAIELGRGSVDLDQSRGVEDRVAARRRLAPGSSHR